MKLQDVAYSSSRISLRNAGQFLNARNGVGHQVNLVEDIIPDVLLCAITFENCYTAKRFYPIAHGWHEPIECLPWVELKTD